MIWKWSAPCAPESSNFSAWYVYVSALSSRSLLWFKFWYQEACVSWTLANQSKIRRRLISFTLPIHWDFQSARDLIKNASDWPLLEKHGQVLRFSYFFQNLSIQNLSISLKTCPPKVEKTWTGFFLTVGFLVFFKTCPCFFGAFDGHWKSCPYCQNGQVFIFLVKSQKLSTKNLERAKLRHFLMQNVFSV